MNLFCKIVFVLFLFFVSVNEKSFAQFIPSDYEIGINAGTLIYQGDLSKGNFGYLHGLKPAIGLYGAKSLNEFFSARVTMTVGWLGADESTYSSPAWTRHRNLKFSTPVFESSAQLVWDLIGKSYRYEKHRLSPYFFIGAGLSFVDVKRDWSRFDTTYFGPKSAAAIGLGIDTLHRTPRVIPVLPLGMGLRYMLTSQLALTGEITYRITPSDYLDGFSHAGDPQKKDHYYGISIGLSYRFGSDRMDCPKVRK